MADGEQVTAARLETHVAHNPGDSLPAKLLALAYGAASNQVWWFKAQPHGWLAGCCQPYAKHLFTENA